jgi:inner membrane protein
MPTIMTHAVVPLAAGLALGRGRVPLGLVGAGMALAILPDLDVVSFRLGIAYADQLGHRGATHSLVAAIVVAGLVTLIMRPANKRTIFSFLALSMASHGLLDMLTNGGLGVALFWPFESTRHFFPITPIRVSPIGAGFFSERGIAVIQSELRWVWLPALGLAGLTYMIRQALRRA